MEKIREYLKNPVILGAVCFIVGLAIGLFVLGWGIFPVQWVDAAPRDLRSDYQMDYLKMAIQSFAANPDVATAQARYAALGPGAKGMLSEVETEGIFPTNEIKGFEVAVTMTGSVTAVPTGSTTTTALATTAPATTGTTLPVTTATPASSGKSGSLLLPLLLSCLALIVIGAALVYIFFIRKKPTTTEAASTEPESPRDSSYQPERVEPAAKDQEAPIAQFMTTFMAGDDMYDDSFSIDSPSGEFLGECGVGISDTIGVGEPKKVTAFEVWLFDKNDIQTVTKVLMSTHAFNDANIHQRLESKGEPILSEAGKRILLETATLQLEARVVDIDYGQSAMPTNSYFERLTLELAVWPKPTA